MPAAHIAGLPLEETLLSLGGPAALYLAALGVLAATRRARLRLGGLLRHRPGVGG
jgi:hypothetical protein